MYYAAAIILTVFYIAAAVAHFFISTPRGAKIWAFISAGCGITGFIVTSVSALSFYIGLESSDCTEEVRRWASKTYSFYLKIMLIAAVVICAVIIVSSLMKTRAAMLRKLVTALFSVLIIIIGAVFAFIFQKDGTAVKTAVQVTSLGISLLAELPAFFDFRKQFIEIRNAGNAGSGTSLKNRRTFSRKRKKK